MHPFNMLIGHCCETDRFNSKTRMPEARVVLKEEYIHTYPVGKFRPSMIRLQDALLLPPKQLQIIGGWGHYKLCKADYSENCKLL